MSEVAISVEQLKANLEATLEGKFQSIESTLGEITVTVSPANYVEVMQILKSAPLCQFEQLIDLCGLDYSEYGDGIWEGNRFCVVTHLLSVALNQRVRVKAFCDSDDFPVLPSVIDIWNAANWFEREAFDLYGIMFDGHNDLRRILTDYGFVGHPFRKDFPLSGHMEMRYDEERKRVIYEPVSIEPREITSRVIREENYGGLH